MTMTMPSPRGGYRWLPVLLVLTTMVVSSPALDPMKKDRVDRVVRQLMQCGRLSAVGLAMVGLDENMPHYVQAYGASDRSRGNQLMGAKIDTRFCLGGATEAFTAVLLAKLIHENENVTWSTPIQDITKKRVVMPDLYRSSHLNLMDILAQRSGMPSMDIVPLTHPFSVRRLINNLRYVKPAAGFREKYIPNQILFSLLDDVFEALGGDTFENLVKRHIFKPLAMNSVIFLGDKSSANAVNVAYPVVHSGESPQTLPLDAFHGLGLIKSAASVCLSPKDLSKWIRFTLDGKGPKGKQIMNYEVVKGTFPGVQSRGHEDKPEIVGYGQPNVQVSYTREQNALGWITGQYRGYRFVSQDGSLPGTQALSTILPSRNIAVFAAITGDAGRRSLAAKVLLNIFSLDLMMTGKTWFTEGNVCNLMNEMVDTYPDTTHYSHQHAGINRVSKYQGARSLNSYVGYYRNYGLGDVFVKHNETEDLDLQMEYGMALYKLTPTNMNDTFELIAKGALSYTSYSNNYRNRRIIAKFVENPRDPKRRSMSTMTISGFAEDDVVFSSNPVAPYYESGQDSGHCSASSTSASSLMFFVSMLCCGLVGLYR